MVPVRRCATSTLFLRLVLLLPILNEEILTTLEDQMGGDEVGRRRESRAARMKFESGDKQEISPQRFVVSLLTVLWLKPTFRD